MNTTLSLDEAKLFNELMLRLPCAKRKALWDSLNNHGKKDLSGIDSLSLRESLKDSKRKGLRWN